ncbi:hypothetical protein CHLRE_12g534450v5 [Chlamydomonas reinhardtii]|uniref:Uncharacterized protein n=1 Tax=Chlamydomonas reinhardtii TaxID=3055 RepID=A8IVP1_CHLRE|nr:uncharacterized protein CHLRE_12g534450v5 [Chlamydomonas reinhardtii]PNW75625.1 hypothetical protein CHLRE_12g534450v5 [Chlamydomonas reinhardtii]|eukprot:XP_001692997.1 predicted protein [Chlamydomonas reinhardtii]
MQVSFARSTVSRARAGISGRTSRRTHVAVSNKLVLQPIGSGSTEHLDGEKVTPPGPVPLREGTLDVGRVEPCDIVLPVPTVSSRHAILTIEGDKVLVIDVNSTNGTMVNGAEIKAMDYVELPIGGEIVFGDEFLAKFQLQKLPDDA